MITKSNRFKLSDSLVDSPRSVNAGGAVGRASATGLLPAGEETRNPPFSVPSRIPVAGDQVSFPASTGM